MRPVPVTALAFLMSLASCAAAPGNDPDKVKHIASVRLGMVWSPGGPDAMVARTLALERALTRTGFVVTRVLPGQPAPAVTYPHVSMVMQQDQDWCLRGVVRVHGSPDQRESFELQERDGDADQCSARIVSKLLERVRPPG